MTDQNHISLSQLTALIARALTQGAGGTYWVVAQVVEAKLNYSGHFYMELTEKADGQSQPMASARAVIWSRTYVMLAPYFRQVTGGDISAGQQILLKCSVSFHAVYGLSLVVQDLDPTYTLGWGEMVRQRTIDRLSKEGVVDMNRALELPLVVQRLAVISSATAAGYEDFMNELEGSGVAFDVDLYQATMQGQAAESSIIAALEAVMDQQTPYDAVVVIRGGGSKGDLACFDNYELCANIAQFPLPIISGIGHERDVSALDMVACQSRKTPTAVATMLVDKAYDFLALLNSAQQQIQQSTLSTINKETQTLTQYTNFLSQKVQRTLSQAHTTLQTLTFQLKQTTSQQITHNQQTINNFLTSIPNQAHHYLLSKGQTLENVNLQLNSTTTNTLQNLSHSLQLITLQIQSANPKRILSMGYAIIRNPATQNSALKSINNIKQGQTLQIELADGQLITRIEEITPKASG